MSAESVWALRVEEVEVETQEGAERNILAPTAVGGFDTEPDEFSDFDRLRTALPTSGSSTGESPSS